LVYVHNANYDATKIKIAVDIIDSLHKIKGEFSYHSDENIISSDLLKTINEEFVLFVKQKNLLLSDIKENHKKTVKQIEDLSLSNLEIYLSNKFSNVNKTYEKFCDICNKQSYFTNDPRFNNQMAGHKNRCMKTYGIKPPIQPDVIIQDIVLEKPELNNINITSIKKKSVSKPEKTPKQST
jgi:hypothetical protein